MICDKKYGPCPNRNKRGECTIHYLARLDIKCPKFKATGYV